MPMYTFQCHVCKREWPTMRTVTSRDQAAQCPYCHSWHTWKKPSVANFTVKGFSAKNGYSK